MKRRRFIAGVAAALGATAVPAASFQQVKSHASATSAASKPCSPKSAVSATIPAPEPARRKNSRRVPYPAEGDANLIAFLATALSNDPVLQYSGWLNLWLYVRSPELDTLLLPGPRGDLQRVFDRIRGERVRWIGNFQTAILDWYLKANSVPEGVRSYSQVVLLAAGTEPFWDRFR